MDGDLNINVVLGETGVVLAVFDKEEGLMSDVAMHRVVVAAMEPSAFLYAAYGNDELYNIHSALMSEGSVCYLGPDPEFEQLYQNATPDGAQEILEEAGYGGEEIGVITTRDYEDFYNNSMVLQQQLEDAGMNVDLVVADWPTVTQIREYPSAYVIFITDIFNWPSVSATFHFFTPSWPGWTDSDEIFDAALAMIAAEDEDGAVAAVEGLQDTYSEYLPV